jgi:RND family efflux transporter MFP subunit
MASDHRTPAPHDHVHGDDAIDPARHRPSRRGLIVTLAVAIAALSTLVLVGMAPRLRAATEIRDDRERAAAEPARVQVGKPMRQGAGGKVVLPGTVQALQEAVVYARTSGYVRSFTVDIGDPVKAGQVLATLDTPEIDQELRAAQAATVQASANIAQARTQLAQASTESTRYQALAGSGVVSQQDMEQRRASFDTHTATLRAMEAARGSADANLQRLRELKGFATVTAPFDGVITTRGVELGQLVASGTGQAMFRVANTSVVRVFVNVPQVYAQAVRVGGDATITLRELPARPFTGQVTRSSGALDPATRTLLTEIRIPNPDGALLPGMYAQLSLAVTRADGPLMIPPAALVADGGGTRVAVVEHGSIRWHPVRIDSDLGDQIAVLSGLKDSDDVVLAPTDRLADGLLVTAEQAPKAAPPGAGSGKSGGSGAAAPGAR